MKLKTVEVDGKTYAEVQDGKPVFLSDDGKEQAIDVPQTVATISRLNGEAKGHRERAEAAEKALKAFEGIEDAEAARKALDKLKSIDDKQLIDAGKVEEVKQAAIAAVKKEYEPYVEKAKTLEQQLHNEIVGGSFARSKFITEKVAVPADLIQAQFGRHFAVEDGKLTAKDANGNPIYSRSNPGEIAGFDEALEALIDQYQYKDHILKGRGQQGSGARPGADGGTGGKTISRAEFDKLDPGARMKRVQEGVEVVD